MDTSESLPPTSGLAEIRKKSAEQKQKEKNSLVDLWLQDLNSTAAQTQGQKTEDSK